MATVVGRHDRLRGGPVDACGSHAAHSHTAGSSATTTRRQSAGPVHAASWTINDRAIAAPCSPTIAIDCPDPRLVVTGTSSSSSWRSTIAKAVDERSSAGPAMRASHGIVPQPSVTANPSAWIPRRAHSSLDGPRTAARAASIVGAVARWKAAPAIC